MKKKITVILIVLLVSVTLFSACISSENVARQELSTAIANGYNATQIDYSQKVSHGDVLLSSIDRTYVKAGEGWKYDGVIKSLNDNAYGDVYIENKESGTAQKPPLPAISIEFLESVSKTTEGEEVIYDVKLLADQLQSFLGLTSEEYEKVSDASILITAKDERISSVTLEYSVSKDIVTYKISYTY